mgnify:CR=1 FL=1
MIERLINNVLDVPGVEGLCLFDLEGKLQSNYLPEYCLDELIDGLITRVISLFQTIDDSFVPCDDHLLKFPGKWLLLRRGKEGFLFVLMEEGVNQVTLKMTTNLLLKHINVRDMDGGATSAPASPSGKSAPLAQGSNPRAAPTPNTRAPRPVSRPTRAPFPESGQQSQPPLKRKRLFRGSSY